MDFCESVGFNVELNSISVMQSSCFRLVFYFPWFSALLSEKAARDGTNASVPGCIF
jgi:hypothetical protein